MLGPKPVTIEDVATVAGVHASTVSRALSRPDKVASATREKVEAVAAELGFVPNRAARGLITGKSGNIALIVPDITNPHFSAMVKAAGRAARESDRQLLLVDTGEHPDEEVRAARTLSREVDALIVVSPRHLHRQLDVIGATRAIFVDRPVEGHSSVLMRAGVATAAALNHLAELGHRHIAYVPGPKASWAAAERRNAVTRRAKRVGVTIERVDATAPTFEAAVGVVPDILAGGATAVMAFNDQMALGVIAGLTARGVRVPSDVSVVGCDDVPMAAMTSPALTTIRMPVERAGEEAIRLLDGSDTTVELAGELVIRDSTGPL